MVMLLKKSSYVHVDCSLSPHTANFQQFFNGLSSLSTDQTKRAAGRRRRLLFAGKAEREN
jgi:hypothetical protein